VKLTRFGWKEFLFILIGLASVLRLASCLADNPLENLFSDPGRHWNNAVRFFEPDLMGGVDPILYQVFLRGMILLSFGEKWLLGMYTGLLCAVMPWIYYRAAREFGMAKVPALTVWLLIVWMPSLWNIYSYFMMETLLLPLVGLGLWMTGRVIRKKTGISFLVASGVWMLAVLTKTVAAPLMAICLLFAWWRIGCPIRVGFMAAALALLMLLPNAMRTHQVLGFASPLGMSWITRIQHRSSAKHIEIFWNEGQWIFSSPSAYVRPFFPLTPWMISRAYNNEKVVVYAQSINGEEDWKAKFNSLPLTMRRFSRLDLENGGIFLFAPSWPDGGDQSFLAQFNTSSRWLWAPLILFCIFGNLSVVRRGWRRALDPIALATTGLILFLLLQPLVTMEGRYRKPLEPLLIINAVGLVVVLTGPRSTGGSRREKSDAFFSPEGGVY